jgi:hypothetical protein
MKLNVLAVRSLMLPIDLTGCCEALANGVALAAVHRKYQDEMIPTADRCSKTT